MKFVRRFIVLIGGAFNGLFVLLLIATAYSPYIDPTVHPMWSCLGLAFPVFLLTDIAFLLLWIIVRQYKMALLPLAGLLLCYGQIRTYIPLNFPAEHVPEGSLCAPRNSALRERAMRNSSHLRPLAPTILTGTTRQARAPGLILSMMRSRK